VHPFIDRIVTYVKYRSKQRVKLMPKYRAPLLDLLLLLTPVRAEGKGKIRVGASRDGGYVMLDDFSSIDAALSLGIGPDISWDHALADRGLPVWQYDHTISVLPSEHPLCRFEPKRIVNQSASSQDLPLTVLLQQFAGKQLILKMDIEGDEWDVLAGLSPGLLATCRQIVVEFHDFISIENQAWRDQARRALALLARDFGVVHVHGNNLSKHIVFDDLVLPDSLEVTFANRSFYKLGATDETFPGRMDKRNNPYFPDFNLGHFRFGHDKENS
jgi:hypothetical protein